MSGLVAYESSDDDGEVQDVTVNPSEEASESHTATNNARRNTNDSNSKGQNVHEDVAQQKTNGQTVHKTISNPQPSTEPASPLVGPILGPTIPLDELMQSPSPAQGEVSAPLSPYSSNRALLRQLTVPPIPNLDIPPSPPRSPPLSTNQKFTHFLDLKRQGVHFNQKLSRSAALKNPSLMQKLMSFAGIDEADQYTSTLPEELWNAKAFPEWAYKEGLAKSQQQILKKNEEEKMRGQREAVDFVPATISEETARNGLTVGNNGRASTKSAAERVMAGLERPRSNSPQIQAGVKRKTRFES
ncbi:MAG: hypothetical protein M1818_000999 [Claussenomyces sp. TS43310]|nr:MAG: hypothetical protein M1818_000999 [Claussenomyces sp. TS43310]